MKKAKITDLRKYLEDKSNKELIDEIVELFKSNKQVQESYTLKVDPENEKILLEEYKDKVCQQFFPDRGLNVLNYSILKKLISEFETVAINKSNIIELLLCYAENGVDFTNSFGDIDGKFYRNIAKIFEKALKLIVDNKLEEKYLVDCQRIMNESIDIGWGFGDWMCELFYDYIGGFEEE